MKASHLQSAPAQSIRNCLAIYQIPKPISKLREVLAMVVFDSAINSAIAGVRGAHHSQQLLLPSETVDVHLRVGGTPRMILGQILERPHGDFVVGARVALIQMGEQLEVTITDGLGEFRLARAPAGHLRFQAELGTTHCLIGEFTIEEEEIS